MQVGVFGVSLFYYEENQTEIILYFFIQTDTSDLEIKSDDNDDVADILQKNWHSKKNTFLFKPQTSH